MTQLTVRLPNHLGDTLMAMPALDRLHAAGIGLTLLGKGWARALFAAYPWRVEPLAAGARAVIAQWRALAAQTPEALLFTNSFGSALAARLGGVRAAGYATDGRGWLLARAVPVPARWRGDMHTVEYFDTLAAAWLDQPERVPPPLMLRLPAAAHERARGLLADAGVTGDYIVLCPGATGRHRGRDKAWQGFDRLTAWLQQRGETVVALPGPGERARYEQALPGATILPEVDVAAFGALLAGSRLVVANDSGPGHLAAAVDANLVSLFGVTEIAKTRPWGRRVAIVGSEAGWPGFDRVSAAVEAAITSG